MRIDRQRKERSRFEASVIALVLATATPLACSDATDVELLEIDASGVLFGQAFLDLDGSGGLSTADEPLEEVGVIARTSSGDVVSRATTDTAGVFLLEDIPVGSYSITLDPDVLADSLELLDSDDPVSVGPADTAALNLGATFPVLTLEEALAAPVGRRVFTSGIALNERVNFGDGQVHFSGETEYLRALNVERSSVARGDSVRIRGRVVTDNGRVALRDVTPFILIRQAALVVPVEVTVSEASTADGGRLDAALGRIRNAEITDTSTNAEGDFRFWAVGEGDSVEVVLREFLALNEEAFRPDTTVRLARLDGLLSAFDDGGGSVRWRMLPRDGSDVSLQTKRADVSVSASLDTTEASLGDIIEVTVVAANGGPLTATEVQVRDTIPDPLTFVSATVTVGTYDPATGVWDIGDLESQASDTLRILMEVTDESATSATNVAESLGLTFEVDPNSFNNRAVLILTIS